MVLNSSDRLFAELRDASFAAVGPRLGEKAKLIQTNYQGSKVCPSLLLSRVYWDQNPACVWQKLGLHLCSQRVHEYSADEHGNARLVRTSTGCRHIAGKQEAQERTKAQSNGV